MGGIGKEAASLDACSLIAVAAAEMGLHVVGGVLPCIHNVRYYTCMSVQDLVLSNATLSNVLICYDILP